MHLNAIEIANTGKRDGSFADVYIETYFTRLSLSRETWIHNVQQVSASFDPTRERLDFFVRPPGQRAASVSGRGLFIADQKWPKLSRRSFFPPRSRPCTIRARADDGRMSSTASLHGRTDGSAGSGGQVVDEGSA